MRLQGLAFCVGMGLAFGSPTRSALPPSNDALIVERSIAALDADLASGRTTSESLVSAYFSRIAKIDRSGPRLRSVIAINPDAVKEARGLDAERRAGHIRGPLHGIPILIKDNIESRDPMPTTAGSLALAANVTLVDAPVVARLRAAGAIILGKTNLSEWANFRSTHSISGWSAVGGLTLNPYAPNRNSCGSSAGSGAAAAASLAAATVGTETDGSITCPASINGLVGLKPTVGLVSRARIVPISQSQDTAGPMGRTVRDVAILMGVMAGSDAADPATRDADAHRSDYARSLDVDALRGKRIGVLRFAAGFNSDVDRLFDAALAQLRLLGATTVEIERFDDRAIGEAEKTVLLSEFKGGIDAYLASAPPAVKVRSLNDLVQFNVAHAEREMPLFGQDEFEKAQAAPAIDSTAYREAVSTARKLAGAEGIDRMLVDQHLDMLVSPTVGPAWTNDLVNGDHFSGGGAGSLPAVAGYPHLTVPMGQVKGLPVGLSFIGPAWSEARLLSMGYAYEQASHARKPPGYQPIP